MSCRQQVKPELALIIIRYRLASAQQLQLPAWLETIFNGEDWLFSIDNIPAHTATFWLPVCLAQCISEAVLTLIEGPVIVPTVTKVVAATQLVVGVDNSVGDLIAEAVRVSCRLLFTYPFDLVKTRTVFGTVTHPSHLSLTTIYRGFWPTFVGMAVYRGTSCMVTAALNDVFGAQATAVLAPLVAGALAYPLDTLRIRMILDPEQKDAESSLDAILEGEGGAAVLWNGVGMKLWSACCYGVVSGTMAQAYAKYTLL